MEVQEILRAMQKLARQVQAIRRPLDSITELGWRGEKVDKAAISHILRRESTQKELALNWETLLYRHVSGQYVLICTALPDNANDAQTLVTRRLINSREACAFCSLVENSYAPIELVVATDPVGQPIPIERVHPRCSLYWQRLKLIAEGK
ncbi:hypothetical protein ACIQUS_23150 [Pseudomonas sp. NPDC090755]|uniref:hypothetical protein n=1 Tax=Pseudomonas sp. NPDC090755 TaxID=3364481 RepID=UPI00383A15D3